MKDKMAADYVLLGALMVEPKHGYEIRKFLDQTLESKWHIGNSQMYALLKRLEERQLVKSMLAVQSKRPAKRIYSLTPKGKSRFFKWIQRPVMHVRNLRIEFIAKLFFIRQLSLSSGIIVIQNQIDALNHMLEKIMRALARERRPFERLSLRFRQVTIEAYIQWLKTAAYEFIV